MVVEGDAAPSEGEGCLLFRRFSFILVVFFSIIITIFWGFSTHVLYFVCSIQGSANRSSRQCSKRPADRQSRRADINEEAEDDEVGDQFRIVKRWKWKATVHVGVVYGDGTSFAPAVEVLQVMGMEEML
ncbi:uncharacterized protein LOC125525777 [Triticum urartu]|uniref:uncharacterized protein LOC125525777 n=1 Tax=Triticum urartu TaxID=4572 RepID=UPI002042CF18|nr:uncharacterized protein LOC125525777 [Triticum urartu]